MRLKFYTPAFLLMFLAASSVLAQINVTFPSTRIVMQRNNANTAAINITGTFDPALDRIEARLNTRPNETGVAVGWTTISNNPSGRVFSGSITGTGGRYNLEVRGIKNNTQVGSSVVIERVGVGEVFLIVGHSNAAGGSSPSLGAESDMVSSINPIAVEDGVRKFDDYFSKGDPELLPAMKFSQLCGECGMSPGVRDISYFWGKTGDKMVERLKVPILFYSAAFGGTNMEQTYMAAYDIPFVHSFVNYNVRMPYVNIRNAFKKYTPQTGLRAVLSGHGVNDRFVSDPEASFVFNNTKVIEKTRQESGYANLPWLVATSGFANGRILYLESAQLSIRLSVHDVWKGPDLNEIGNDKRADGVHFNVEGQKSAGLLWADAVTDTDFLKQSTPMLGQMPALPPAPPLPVTLVKFQAKTLDNQRNMLNWTTSEETNNDHFEIQRSEDAQTFETIGIRAGEGTTKALVEYSFIDEKPFNDIVYYRLKQVDKDGMSEFSRIVAVLKPEEKNGDYIFPNPTGATVEVAAEGVTVSEVTIFDLKGNVVLVQKSPKQIDVSSLIKGDYILQAKTENGRTIRKKMVKL